MRWQLFIDQFTNATFVNLAVAKAIGLCDVTTIPALASAGIDIVAASPIRVQLFPSIEKYPVIELPAAGPA